MDRWIDCGRIHQSIHVLVEQHFCSISPSRLTLPLSAGRQTPTQKSIYVLLLPFETRMYIYYLSISVSQPPARCEKRRMRWWSEAGGFNTLRVNVKNCCQRCSDGRGGGGHGSAFCTHVGDRDHRRHCRFRQGVKQRNTMPPPCSRSRNRRRSRSLDSLDAAVAANAAAEAALKNRPVHDLLEYLNSLPQPDLPAPAPVIHISSSSSGHRHAAAVKAAAKAAREAAAAAAVACTRKALCATATASALGVPQYGTIAWAIEREKLQQTRQPQRHQRRQRQRQQQAQCDRNGDWTPSP